MSSASWRLLNALVLGGAFYWDTTARPECLHHMTLWTCALHAVFFLVSAIIPAKPVVAVLHGMSYTGSFIVLFGYLFFLVLKPDLDFVVLEAWGFTATQVILRSFLLHGWPVIAHYVDVTLDTKQLASIYKSKGWRVWAMLGFVPFSMVYEHYNPSLAETYSIDTISPFALTWISKLIGAIAGFIGTSLLFQLTQVFASAGQDEKKAK